MFLTHARRGVVLAVLVAAVATGCSDDESADAPSKDEAAGYAEFCQAFRAQDPQDDYQAYKRAIADLWKSRGKEAVPPSVRAGYTTYVDVVQVAFTAPGYEALLTDLSDDDAVDLENFQDFVDEEC